MSKKDYYKVLGVNKTDSDEVIKKAYKKLVKQYHPDMHSNIDEKTKKEYTVKFQEINNAYETLKDPNNRRIYDQVGPDQYNNYKQGGAGAGGFNGFEGFDGFGGDFQDMGDFFSSFFGGQKSSVMRGENLMYDMEITLEEAYNGFTYQLKTNKKNKCLDCSGYGNTGAKSKTCGKCGGTGKQRNIFNSSSTCNSCAGEGKVCTSCSGEGRIDSLSQITINIPAGVYENYKISISKEGNAGVRGGIQGDLIVKFKIKPHNVFKIQPNQDLHLNMPISIFQAILGDTIEIPLIDGTVMEYKLTSVIQPNSKYKISGKGMKIVGKSYRSDLYVIFDIKLPESIESKEKENWQQLKEMNALKVKNKGILSSVMEYLKNIKNKI